MILHVSMLGKTTNIKKPLSEHNRGESSFTKPFIPWKLETYIAFENEQLAVNFEKYLKAGSGFAFLKR